MKLKNFIKISALPALLMASAVAFAIAKPQKSKEARAETDVGTVTVNTVRNNAGDHFDNNIYMVLNETTALPDSWDYPYTAVGESSGVFINGELQVGAVLKHANGNDIHYALPRALSEGEVVEFKGTFATTSAGGYTFSIDYGTQRLGGDWVRALEDYDVVSLKDANMPDFASGATINTDDMGGDYTYTTDRYALPTRKGYFGLTNDTGSYAFQMGYQKSSTATGWFHVLIGGKGPLWNAGHFMDFAFLDNWANTGHAMIKEMTGKGNYWEGDEVRTTDAIQLGWNVGERNILEMGLIKVKDSSQHLVFFKVNGALKFSDYWTLADGQMTTKVTLQYANTDATVTNSVEPASVRLHTSDGTMTGLYIESDTCPAIHNWDDFFMSTDKNGLKLNGTAFGNETWNYFKKTSATGFYLDLGEAGAGSSFSKGDVLYIGGMFKTARIINDIRVLFKVNFADTYFEYDGEQWVEGNPSYEAGDFAKDLLKLTLPVCSAASDGNGSALTSIWLTLNDQDHYKALFADEKALIKDGSPDASVVVPNTDAGIEEMLPEDAIGAALYRYDYCCAKYSLTNFIDRTLTVSFGSNLLNPVTVETSNTFIIIVIISIVSISSLGLLVYKRKHR